MPALPGKGKEGGGDRGKTSPPEGLETLDPKLKAFFLLVFLFTLGNSSNQFLLLRAKNLGFDAAHVILAYLVFNLVYAASAYPAGRLSDMIGRRTLLVFGYLFYGLAYLGEMKESRLIDCTSRQKKPLQIASAGALRMGKVAGLPASNGVYSMRSHQPLRGRFR